MFFFWNLFVFMHGITNVRVFLRLYLLLYLLGGNKQASLCLPSLSTIFLKRKIWFSPRKFVSSCHRLISSYSFLLLTLITFFYLKVATNAVPTMVVVVICAYPTHLVLNAHAQPGINCWPKKCVNLVSWFRPCPH